MTEITKYDYDRGTHSNFILIQDESSQRAVLKTKALCHLGTDTIVRIRNNEYPSDINSLIGTEIGHFGLYIPEGSDRVGERVAIARIVEDGHFDHRTGYETLPLLSFADIVTGQITANKPSFNCSEVTDDMFKPVVFGGIKTTDQLRHALISRYSVSTSYSLEEILALPISYRRTLITGTISEKEYQEILSML